MMMLRTAALLLALLASFGAQAASTINPNAPANNSPLTSSTIRNNFLAAYTDINNILGGYAGTSPPASPVNLQTWIDTNTSPVYIFKYRNNQTATWVPYGSLNVNTGVWSPYASAGSFAATAPLAVGVSAGVATYSINLDSRFSVNGSSQLALANQSSGQLLANCTGGSAEPGACTWSQYADVVGASNGMLPYRTGGSWSSVSTGIAGHTLPFLDAAANQWSGIQTAYPGASTLQAALTGTLFRASSLDGTASRFEATAYGSTGIFTGARVGGTAASPTAVVANDEIASFNAWAYNGTVLSGPAAALRVYSGGTWSGTNQPTYIDFATTAQGDATRTLTSRMRVENNGGVTVGGASSQGAGTLNLLAGLYNNGTAPVGTGGYVRAASDTTTINTVACQLGTSCTISATAGSVTVGTTTIVSGTDTRILRNASGVLGEYTITGTGTVVVMQGTPTITTPTINGGTLSALAGLGVRSLGGGAFDLQITNNETLTASRAINIMVQDGPRAVSFGGNVTFAGSVTFPTIAAGDILYGSATAVLSALAKSASATRYLSNTGASNIPAWAQIDLTNGVVNALPIANGGTAQATAIAARQDTGLNIYGDAGTPHGDAGVTLGNTERFSYTSAAFTASRAWVLPAANVTAKPYTIKIADLFGGVTASNTLVITRAGADTINGGTTVTISAANGGYECSSDGSSKWSCLSMGAASAGGVSSITAGNGLSGGVINTSGTIAMRFDPGSVTNCKIAETHPSNALTLALVTQAGSTPSATDPCVISFPDLTGGYTAVAVTAATTFATDVSGSTFGSANNVPFRLYVVALNNGGTAVIGVVKASSATAVRSLNEAALQTSVACSACNNATTFQTIYTTATQTSKAMRVLGSLTYESGLATAGTYASSPTTITLVGPNFVFPGRPTGNFNSMACTPNTTTSSSGTAFVASVATITLTPSSAANLVDVSTYGAIGFGGNAAGALGILRGGTLIGNAVASYPSVPPTSTTLGQSMGLRDFPQTTASTTWAAGIKSYTGGVTQTFGAFPTLTDTGCGISVSEVQG